MCAFWTTASQQQPENCAFFEKSMLSINILLVRGFGDCAQLRNIIFLTSANDTVLCSLSLGSR